MVNPESGFKLWGAWGMLAEAEVDRERENLRNKYYFDEVIAKDSNFTGQTVVIAGQTLIASSPENTPTFRAKARTLVKKSGLDPTCAIVRKVPVKS